MISRKEFTKLARAELKRVLPTRKGVQEEFIKSMDKDIYRKCCFLMAKHNLTMHKVVFKLAYPAPVCPTCKVNKTKQKDGPAYYKYCSVKCAQNDASVRKKFETSMIQNHGVSYTGQSRKLRKKMMNSAIRHFGSKDKLRQHRNAETRKTCMLRYGVSHITHSRFFMDKISLSGKQVRVLNLDSKEFRLRGYEPMAVSYLHQEKGIPVNNIKTTSAEGVPSIKYDFGGKTRIYHPDFLVKFNKKWGLVEVKSSFTSGLKSSLAWWNILQAKAKACVDEGYPFRLLLVMGKRELHSCVIISNIHLKSREEVRREVESRLQQ